MFDSKSETKVKTSYINKNSNDELYNVTHNYIKRKAPNTISSVSRKSTNKKLLMNENWKLICEF